MADEPLSQSRPNPPTLFPRTTAQAPASPSPISENKNEGSKLSAIQRNENGKPYVLDKNGKPCRLCTSAAAWRNLTKQSKASTAAASTATAIQPQETQYQSNSTGASTGTLKAECPPDVEALGRSTWTLLHSLTATYPEKASPSEQAEMRSFLTLLSKLYPCWVCADDFRNWMAEPSGKNQPRLGGRSDFGNWMCEAHNEVNRKLGKKEFDCRFWEERWKDGWKDGRCD
ncbi:ERV/ALR sulfhydryl oxidase domain-containing protein [Aspergillus desertorum]